MIAHYPENMDSGGKVREQETASGSVWEHLPAGGEADVTLKGLQLRETKLKKLSLIWNWLKRSDVVTVGLLNAPWGESVRRWNITF